MPPKHYAMNKRFVRLQYAIAALLMAAIAAAGYFIGRDRPIPAWIERFLMPGLGWLGLVLIVIIVIDWIKRRQD
jgi:hypothetical protein